MGNHVTSKATKAGDSPNSGGRVIYRARGPRAGGPYTANETFASGVWPRAQGSRNPTPSGFLAPPCSQPSASRERHCSSGTASQAHPLGRPAAGGVAMRQTDKRFRGCWPLTKYKHNNRSRLHPLDDRGPCFLGLGRHGAHPHRAWPIAWAIVIEGRCAARVELLGSRKTHLRLRRCDLGGEICHALV